MTLQRFSVVHNGTPVRWGLRWLEARGQARDFIVSLGLVPGDVISISETSLDEPRLTWTCSPAGWQAHLEPPWSDVSTFAVPQEKAS